MVAAPLSHLRHLLAGLLLLSCFIVLSTQAKPLDTHHAHPVDHLHRRDAFTITRGVVGDTSLMTMGQRPRGAYARYIPVGKQGQIFTWYSKSPHNESLADSVFIIIHGVARNANEYWTTLNKTWSAAAAKGIGSASPNAIRVAPSFFSTIEDRAAYNSSNTTLAWGDSNAWTAGEPSTNPANSSVSSFTVLDTLLKMYADKKSYPKMKTVTFIAHGGGAQMLQRYAVFGMANPAPSRLSVRYVVGDPSSMIYFTPDRPVGVDQGNCSLWNQYRYSYDLTQGLGAALNYSITKSPAALFKAYAAKDVRYVVGLNDVKPDKGDQTCMARSVGGWKRRNRSLAYWKYIHVLAGYSGSLFRKFPGAFPALNPTCDVTLETDIPVSTPNVFLPFRGTKVQHSLTVVQGAGHDAAQVYGTTVGRNALFQDRTKASGGTVPDLSTELQGYNSSDPPPPDTDGGDSSSTTSGTSTSTSSSAGPTDSSSSSSDSSTTTSTSSTSTTFRCPPPDFTPPGPGRRGLPRRADWKRRC